MNKLQIQPQTQTGLQVRPEHVAALPPSLPAQIRNAAQLLLAAQPAVKELTSEALRKELYRPMSAVAFLIGHSNSLSEGKDLQLMGTALAAIIHRRWPAMKLAEITEAFTRGASGEWPLPGSGFLAPTLPNFTHWLVCYQEQLRGKALLALDKVREVELLLPPAPPERSYPQAVATLAAHVATHGVFPDFYDLGGCQYEWLKQIGAFAGFWTPQQYQEAMRKETLRRLQRREKTPVKQQEAKAIAQVMRAGVIPQNSVTESILTECKRRLLREWIRYHAARKTDLLTWLTELSHQSQAA